MNYSFYPTKNISLSETLFCLGGVILFIVKNNKGVDIDSCYNLYLSNFIKKNIKYKLNFTNFILAIDYLYILDLIDVKDNILVINNENHKTLFR